MQAHGTLHGHEKMPGKEQCRTYRIQPWATAQHTLQLVLRIAVCKPQPHARFVHMLAARAAGHCGLAAAFHVVKTDCAVAFWLCLFAASSRIIRLAGCLLVLALNGVRRKYCWVARFGR
jgi:hypothetical protein